MDRCLHTFSKLGCAWRAQAALLRLGLLGFVVATCFLGSSSLASASSKKGRLVVTTPIEGAAIRLNGRLVGTTPLPKRGILIKQGRHRLAIDKIGFRPFLRRIRVRTGRTVRIQPKLRARAGVLHVVADVDGAEVEVDGVSWGATPVRAEVTPGKHWVIVREPNDLAPPFEKRVHAPKPGEEMWIEATLQAPPEEDKPSSAYWSDEALEQEPSLTALPQEEFDDPLASLALEPLEEDLPQEPQPLDDFLTLEPLKEAPTDVQDDPLALEALVALPEPASPAPTPAMASKPAPQSSTESTDPTPLKLADDARRDALLAQAIPPRQTLSNAQPWYGKWWVWTLVGAAVAGGTVGAVLGTQGDGDGFPRPDATFFPGGQLDTALSAAGP